MNDIEKRIFNAAKYLAKCRSKNYNLVKEGDHLKLRYHFTIPVPGRPTYVHNEKFMVIKDYFKIT